MSDVVLVALVAVNLAVTGVALVELRRKHGKSRRQATLEHLCGLAVSGARHRLGPGASARDLRAAAIEMARHLDEQDNGRRDFTDRAVGAAVDAMLSRGP